MGINERLREVMYAARINQTQLAAIAGVSKGTVTLWMNGTTKTLSAEIAIRIARATGFSNVWLATGEGPARSDETPVEEPTGQPSTENGFGEPRQPKGYAARSQPATPVDLGRHPDLYPVRRVAIKAQAGVTGYAVEYVGEDTAAIYFRADWYRRNGYHPDKLLALRVTGESMYPSMHPGDLLVVNTASTTPRDGAAFVVSYEGEVVVKRLERDAGQWWLCSDNPDQVRYKRKLCDERTQIIGEVIYRQTEHV